ncbi:MAG: serine protease [Thiofilum sp.]|uniref:S1 family peptidase n=1 Tax=Thiofilum sp. TaxID=2212733 RepID=UPI0025E09455|nr:serine protease [Thiofilum sp.]MBK8452189.1 trypsin-like peptidase domain-containing protein [Thiofilum sp.]
MQALLRWMLLYPLLVFLSISLVMANASYGANLTTNLYAEVESSVYQIRVINKQTGKKITIGSGFVVGREDIIATNYHVISSYVNDMNGYTLDYSSKSGRTGDLILLDLDVVHDLAVLKASQPLGKPLILGTVPRKGANLYSVGNPLDLGLSIVEGTNNGVLEYSADHNILFSGSLNAGMSGGPALDEQGSVVGVNVATSGNEISFLVAARHLGVILDRLKLRSYAPVSEIKPYISRQLSDSMRAYMQEIIKNKEEQQWSYTPIGRFKVPTEISSTVRCWDASEAEANDSLLINYFTQCSNERSVFLKEGIEVGQFQYQYDWFDGGDLWPTHFYRLYESKNGVAALNDKLTTKDVSTFKCFTHFMQIAKKPFKLSICRRSYREYEGLSDVVVNGVMVGEKLQGFVFNIDMIGTEFESSLKVVEALVGAFEWKN